MEPGSLAQLAAGDECRDDRGRDDVAPLVDDEAAVGVAVEGQPHVGPDLADLGLQVAQVLRVDRVGLVVGERAVELEVHRHHVEREPGEDPRDGVAAHAVAGVDGHLERADAGQVDELVEVVGVLRDQVAGRDSANRPVVRGDAVLDHRPDLRQTAFLAHGSRAGLAQLDPVVLGRVVAGGEHRAGDVEGPGGEVEQVRRAQTRVDHVGTLTGRAIGERRAQRAAGLAHVVGHDDHRRPGEPGERRSDCPSHLSVELVRNHTADVVRLDDL